MTRREITVSDTRNAGQVFRESRQSARRIASTSREVEMERGARVYSCRQKACISWIWIRVRMNFIFDLFPSSWGLSSGKNTLFQKKVVAVIFDSRKTGTPHLMGIRTLQAWVSPSSCTSSKRCFTVWGFCFSKLWYLWSVGKSIRWQADHRCKVYCQRICLKQRTWKLNRSSLLTKNHFCIRCHSHIWDDRFDGHLSELCSTIENQNRECSGQSSRWPLQRRLRCQDACFTPVYLSYAEVKAQDSITRLY